MQPASDNVIGTTNARFPQLTMELATIFWINFDGVMTAPLQTIVHNLVREYLVRCYSNILSPIITVLPVNWEYPEWAAVVVIELLWETLWL